MQFPTIPDDWDEDIWMGMYPMSAGFIGYNVMPPELLIEVYKCLGCGKDINKLETFITSGKFVYHVDCFTAEVEEEKGARAITYDDNVDSGGE